MNNRKGYTSIKQISYFALILFLFIYVACNRRPKLKDVFKNYFYIGTALNQVQIVGKDTAAFDILKEQFNSITAENAMKWEKIHPKPGKYYFGLADSFVALGEKQKMYIIGHVLVWHYQTPDWVFQDKSGKLTCRDTLLKRMHDHIFTVVSRYKGRVNGWDVVNEALDDSGQFKKTKWYEIIGEDFVQKAFEFAHEADPDAELIYNDYSLNKSFKRDAVVRLIRELRAKGVKIDGIGEQGHYQLDYPDINELEASIVAFSQLGVKVMITELDINVLPFIGKLRGADIAQRAEMMKELNPYTTCLPDSMQMKLANRYSDLFKLFIKHKDNISRVTIWGIQDGQTWLNYWPIIGRTNYPLLFDRQYKPKPAFYAVIKCSGISN